MKEKLNEIAFKFKKEGVVPFWMWNDRLEKEELIKQLGEIQDKGMNQVIIHPRHGLVTPYLSEEWFTAFSWFLNEAEKRDMGVWIYDELNWPSGYAGGKVLANHPEFQAKHIVKTEKGFEVRKTTWHPAYSQDYYIDVLSPKAVDTFIETTYNQYWKRFKDSFGVSIRGFFTDEPGLYNNFACFDTNSLPWSEALVPFFHQRYGCKLESVLKDIWEEKGAQTIEARVRFWETISLLYQKSFFRKIQDWCHERGVAFIGHVLAEESLVDTAKTQGNFFTTMEFLDFAGYDLLNRLEPKSIIAAKLANSASKLFNLYGVSAETFGMFGRGLTSEEMKRVADWQIKMGLDVLIPHAMYYSLRGDRYNDCPPSLFEDKYWKGFKEFVNFVRDKMKERGKSQTDIAIYYPIETVWGYLSPINYSKAEVINQTFKTTSLACYNLGIDFDYLTSEAILKNTISKYSYLILPSTEVLPVEVLKKIKSFVQRDGKIIVIGELPKFATNTLDQKVFDKELIQILDEFQRIILPKESKTFKMTSFTDRFQGLLRQRIPPSLQAKARHLAKFLGDLQSRQSFALQRPTKIEKELSALIKVNK